MESMTLVNWYRQSQKQMLLQRVLSNDVAKIEILSGLNAGQHVIANPNDSVQEGVKVHPVMLPGGDGGGAKRSR